MKKRTPMIIVGSVLIALALLIMIIPQLTSCQSQGNEITLQNGKTIPMKCYWTGQSELLTGIVLLVIGVMMLVSRRREAQLSLSILGTVLGIMIVLTPTYVIGVCSTMMLCNTLMKPVLLSAGILVILDSLVGLLVAIRAKDSQ